MVTQVILPLIRREHTFPFFRKGRRKLEGKLADTYEKLEDVEIQQEIAEIKDLIKEKKNDA